MERDWIGISFSFSRIYVTIFNATLLLTKLVWKMQINTENELDGAINDYKMFCLMTLKNNVPC